MHNYTSVGIQQYLACTEKHIIILLSQYRRLTRCSACFRKRRSRADTLPLRGGRISLIADSIDISSKYLLARLALFAPANLNVAVGARKLGRHLVLPISSSLWLGNDNTPLYISVLLLYRECHLATVVRQIRRLS